MRRLREVLTYRLVPAIALFLIFIVSTVFLSSYTDASTHTAPAASPDPLQLDQETSAPTPEATEPPVETPPMKPAETPEITDPPEPVCTFTSATGEPLIDYKYGDPVPESQPVEDEYFKDAVFLGDSRTEGFKLYSGLKTADILAAKCINVKNIYSEDVIVNENGEYISIIDALSLQEYAKVYIMLGINELGFDYDVFVKLYASLIDNVREIQPNAEIYLQAIIPVSKDKDERETVYTNKRIRKFNEGIAQLAAEKNLYYIDTYDALSNEEGYLPEDASFDGVHLFKEYCVQWLDYLKTHTVVYDNNAA